VMQYIQRCGGSGLVHETRCIPELQWTNNIMYDAVFN
jgi:hypothetical protein